MSAYANGIQPREARLLSWIALWIPRGSQVLDIGAGSGLLAEAVATTLQANVTLIDIVDNNRSPLPLRLYDGGRLPFDAEEFDIALLAFVLHHSPDARGTVREARRVAGRLLILEDTYRTPLEWVTQRWTDWVLNRGHDVPPPWGQLRPKEWMDFLAREGVRVAHVAEFPPKWLGRYRDPIRHLLIVGEAA